MKRDIITEKWKEGNIFVNMSILCGVIMLFSAFNWIFARFGIYFQLYNFVFFSFILTLRSLIHVFFQGLFPFRHIIHFNNTKDKIVQNCIWRSDR